MKDNVEYLVRSMLRRIKYGRSVCLWRAWDRMCVYFTGFHLNSPLPISTHRVLWDLPHWSPFRSALSFIHQCTCACVCVRARAPAERQIDAQCAQRVERGFVDLTGFFPLVGVVSCRVVDQSRSEDFLHLDITSAVMRFTLIWDHFSAP